MKKKPKILIVRSRYNDTSRLSKSAILMLNQEKISFKEILVNGAFEIPVVISKNIKKYDGFVALGSIIKGETPHFDFISQSVTDSIIQLSINSKKPIGNGIITTLNMKQAKIRSLTKGKEAAQAVLSVLDNF